MIGNPSLTLTLDPLSLHRKVASLSLFYRYYFGHCSDELAVCIPPPMAQPRSTRQASIAHNYCVELSNARMNQVSDGFFPSTSCLWNSPFFCISGFLQKAGLSPPQGPDGIFFLLPFLDISYICFILFIAFLFLFLRDADSRKGTLCPFCVPIHKKKNK